MLYSKVVVLKQVASGARQYKAIASVSSMLSAVRTTGHCVRNKGQVEHIAKTLVGYYVYAWLRKNLIKTVNMCIKQIS